MALQLNARCHYCLNLNSDQGIVEKVANDLGLDNGFSTPTMIIILPHVDKCTEFYSKVRISE